MKNFDAILIPGGGVQDNGDLPPYVKNRLDRAITRSQTAYFITLSAGTTHKPPYHDSNGFPLFESTAAARYLIKHDVDPRRILTETCSYDTIGNAYFSRVIHTDIRRFTTLLIITSAFHLPRTQSIFQWIYHLGPLAHTYELSFESVPDIGIDEKALLLRKEKEERRIADLSVLKNNIATLPELHTWLYTEHKAYAAGPFHIPGDTGDILSTY